MDIQKIQDFYCKANAKLTDSFNLGAIGKDYINQLYAMDKDVIGSINLFKVFPPINYDGNPIQDGEIAEIYMEALEANGISTTSSYEAYSDLLKDRVFKYIDDIQNMEGDVYTPFRKSILNMTRCLYYDNVKYIAIQTGLPQEIEENFVDKVDNVKIKGLVDINGKEELTSNGFKAKMHNLRQDVDAAADSLGLLTVIAGQPVTVESQKKEWFDRKLQENFAVEKFVLGRGGLDCHWARFESVRIKAIYDRATTAVATSVLKAMKP